MQLKGSRGWHSKSRQSELERGIEAGSLQEILLPWRNALKHSSSSLAIWIAVTLMSRLFNSSASALSRRADCSSWLCRLKVSWEFFLVMTCRWTVNSFSKLVNAIRIHFYWNKNNKKSIQKNRKNAWFPRLHHLPINSTELIKSMRHKIDNLFH